MKWRDRRNWGSVRNGTSSKRLRKCCQSCGRQAAKRADGHKHIFSSLKKNMVRCNGYAKSKKWNYVRKIKKQNQNLEKNKIKKIQKQSPGPRATWGAAESSQGQQWLGAPAFLFFVGFFFEACSFDASLEMHMFCYCCLFCLDTYLSQYNKWAKHAWSVDCKQVVVKFMWINCGRPLQQSAQEFEKEKRFMKEQHKRGAWCEIHSTPKPQASVGTVKRCETEWYKHE